MLRVSSQYHGDEVDLTAVVDSKAASASGVEHAEVLVKFAEAVLSDDEGGLEGAREVVRKEMGEAALVDSAAVVANFQRMVRIADATGIPLDSHLDALSGSVREELDLGRFGSSVNTRQRGVGAKLAGAALRGLVSQGAKVVGRMRRQGSQ